MTNKSAAQDAIDNIYSSKMFSKSGWKELSQALRDVSVHSDQDELANFFQEFIEIWMDDNNLSIDLEDHFVKNEKYVYFDEISGDSISTTQKLEDILLERFTDYVEGD